MDVRKILNAQQARQLVEGRGLSHIRVGVFDSDGILRGKYMARDKFLKALDRGFGFCDVVLGWDSEDQLYDNAHFTGWHTGYPDARVRIVPWSCRELPWSERDGSRDLLFLGEFEGRAAEICPRSVLRRALARAEKMGFEVMGGFEYEFFVFDETPQSAARKGYRNLKTLTPGNFGYSTLRSAVHSDLHREILALAESMDTPLEGLHTETGPGVLEAALSLSRGVDIADRAALFKTFLKAGLQRRELMATFMAKWDDRYPGSGGHLHLSLRDNNGNPLFHDAGGYQTLSRALLSFIGGCQRYLPEVLAMLAPTVNAFSRLVPGAWAPTWGSWGMENRTCALRAIPGHPKSQRLEVRVAGADANPYLALAGTLICGLKGIEQGLNPSQPVQGNAYEAQPAAGQAFPATLGEAAARLRGSAVAREALGDAFVEHYAASREWEQRQFQRAITDWELRRYFEII